ncbi:MAG: hypothetical protein ACP5HX_11025, partial [Thermoproteota archaeon]
LFLNFKRTLYNIFVTTLINILFSYIMAILISSYMIVPSLFHFSKYSYGSPWSPIETQDLNSFSNPLSYVLRLYGTDIYFSPNNLWGQLFLYDEKFSLWLLFSLTVPLFSFSTSLICRKKLVLVLTVISIITLFLSKGTREPFGFIYELVVRLPIPFVWVLKHSILWLFVTTLIFSINVTYFMSELHRIYYSKRMLSLLACTYLLVSQVFVAFPLTIGTNFGLFEPHSLPKEFQNINKWLQNDSDYFRVMLLPLFPSIEGFEKAHPASNWALEKPIAAPMAYTQSDFIFFIVELLKSDKDISGPLSSLGIKYVICYKNSFWSDHLVRQPNLVLKTKLSGDVLVFQNIRYRGFISLFNSIAWVSEGAGDAYNRINNSDVAIVSINDHLEVGKFFVEWHQEGGASYIFSDPVSLIMATIPKKYIIGSQSLAYNNSKWFTVNLPSITGRWSIIRYQPDMGLKTIFPLTCKDELSYRFHSNDTVSYSIWIRFFSTKKSFEIYLYIDQQKYSYTINTDHLNVFWWRNLVNTTFSARTVHEIKIVVPCGIGFNALAIIPESILKDVSQKIILAMRLQKPLNYKNSSVTYEIITPDHWIIKVKTNGPVLLHFSEPYDDEWNLYNSNGELVNHLKIQYISNGYIIYKSGTYHLIFNHPNRLVFGYSLSIIFFFSFFVLLIFLRVKKKRIWSYAKKK